MSRIHQRLVIAALFIVSATIAFSSVQAQGVVVRKQLMLASFPATPVSHVDIREINLTPGQRGPLHKHPCPVVGYIISGSVLFQVKGEPPKILKAGDPFFEPAWTVITHFDNASPDQPVKFVINYLIDKEKDFIILLDDKEQPISPAQ